MSETETLNMEDTSTEYDLLDGAGAGESRESQSWIPRGRVVIGGAVFATALVAVIGVVSHTNTSTAASPDVDASRSQSQAPAKNSRVRLRITNGCKVDDLWLANFAFQTAHFPQDLRLAAGSAHDFEIPDAGLAATRFWAKWGCDENGSNCKIGQSGGPGESCSEVGCAPPIDSKFEATFGCLTDKSLCAHNPSDPSQPLGPTDWWDVSQVDGWTLPYKLEVVGDCKGAPHTIDCSGLSLDDCPATEELGHGMGEQSLRLHDPDDSDMTVGCYSPCAKLTFSQRGQGLGFAPDSPEAQDFCCPTPPISPDACSKGPVVKTNFVKAVHRLCPSVYAYAYDDGMGLAQCPAGTRCGAMCLNNCAVLGSLANVIQYSSSSEGQATNADRNIDWLHAICRYDVTFYCPSTS